WDDAASFVSWSDLISGKLEYTLAKYWICSISNMDKRRTRHCSRSPVGSILANFEGIAGSSCTNVGALDLSSLEGGSVDVTLLEILNSRRPAVNFFDSNLAIINDLV